MRNAKPGQSPCGHSQGEPRPDFLCIGAQKSGTSWLYQQLRQHPDFWMPPWKELHYFDTLGRSPRAGFASKTDERDHRFVAAMDSLSRQPFIDLEGYARLFEPKGALISGDITPAYSTLHDEIITLIMQRFPDLKVIFMARDPVERALSSLSQAVRSDRTAPFNITDADAVIQRLMQPERILRSHPSTIVARWRRHVQPDNFRICFFDELEKAPTGFLRSIVRFLGGSPGKGNRRLKVKEKVNTGTRLQFSDQVRFHVGRFFEPELRTCAAELGGPARKWLGRYGLSLCVLVFSLLDNMAEIVMSFDWAV